MNNADDLVAFFTILAAHSLCFSYSKPVAEILKSQVIIRNTTAPEVAAFSCVGPNKIYPEILKVQYMFL